MARGAARKPVQETQAVSSAAIDRLIPAGCSPETALEALIRWVLQARNASRPAGATGQPPLPAMVSELRQAAQARGIPPERFNAALLDRMLSEAESEESARSLPKQSMRERIMEAAQEVFAEKGFHLATVDEIAERAGVGKGTLYRYFANKEALFNELVRMRMEELERNALAVLDGHEDVLTMIAKYLRIYFEFFDRNQRLYRLIVQERLDVGEEVQDLYVRKVMRRLPVLKRKIYEASQQRVFKDVEFQTVFYGVMGFVHGVIQKWLAHDCATSLVDELPTVMEVLFYGFVRQSEPRARGDH